MIFIKTFKLAKFQTVKALLLTTDIDPDIVHSSRLLLSHSLLHSCELELSVPESDGIRPLLQHARRGYGSDSAQAFPHPIKEDRSYAACQDSGGRRKLKVFVIV